MIRVDTQAVLYTKQGVEPQLTQAIRGALAGQGINYVETDLTDQKLDKEWPSLPVLSTSLGFFGGLTEERARALVSLI